MTLFKKVDILSEDEAVDMKRGRELTGAIYKQFNEWHSKDRWGNPEVERLLLKQKEFEISLMEKKSERPATYIFSPSGASKCSRELWFKAMGEKQHDDKYPYHRRWTRNSTAVHEATQKDILSMTMLLKNPAFKIQFLENGLPMWEENIKTHKMIQHNGVEFAVLGMMDGIFQYQDGASVGFEFKTKSNSIGQVGNYKMKEPAPYHKTQCVAYSILFGMDEFILMYEAVAKDQWSKGAEAKLDIRTFYHRVTEADRIELLDKFADVVKALDKKEKPQMEMDKCMFCPYKHLCTGGEI